MKNKDVENFLTEIKDSIRVKENISKSKEILTNLYSLSEMCVKALNTDGKIIFAGNGGSFADSQHLAAEFISRFKMDRDSLASICLGTNSSVVTAIGNDYGFDYIFSREFSSVAQKNDVFIPISTSGNSKNIIEAVKMANNLSINTVALTGKSGGKLKSLCNCIMVPSEETARIQECHILLGHILCGDVESKLFPQKNPY